MEGREALAELVKQYADCVLCPFHAHSKKVHYRGAGDPDVLFVGEAPGKAEDVLGKPFMGRAGKKLDQALDAAGFKIMGLNWGITNALLCRPCDRKGGPNRPPTTLEIKNCAPRLGRMIDIINPAVGLVLLGRKAESAVKRIGLLGRRVWYNYHPAYILRNPGLYKEWVDEFRTIANACRVAKHYQGMAEMPEAGGDEDGGLEDTGDQLETEVGVDGPCDVGGVLPQPEG